MGILKFEDFCESINIPVEIGDVVWMGKFKNKKTIIKDIDVDFSDTTKVQNVGDGFTSFF